MPSLSILNEAVLDELRRSVAARIGEYRLRHTLGVEQAIASLGELYLPQKLVKLRVAALLHDITKEWTPEEQIAFCREKGIPLSPEEMAAPKILHAKTGAYVAQSDYPSLVDDEIADAIREHTVAASEMPVFSALLYLADYIEPTRTYSDCVALRDAFYKGYSEKCKDTHLAMIMVRALQASIDEVRDRGGVPLGVTLEALAFFREKMKK